MSENASPISFFVRQGEKNTYLHFHHDIMPFSTFIVKKLILQMFPVMSNLLYVEMWPIFI